MTHFIDHQTALRRVARNRLDVLRCINDTKASKETDYALLSAYRSRHDAIVQTWAEVRNLGYADALAEIERAAGASE